MPTFVGMTAEARRWVILFASWYTATPKKSARGARNRSRTRILSPLMSGQILTPEDGAQLLLMMRRQTPSPVHRRMNALLLLDDGWTAEQVAKVLFIDAETVHEHRRLYQASGVAGIERLNYEGAASDLNEEQLAALGAELDARLYMTAKAVCAFVSSWCSCLTC